MIEFNPLSPEFMLNPYPYYDMLRANAPVFYWQERDLWFLTRYDDCAAVLKDSRFGHEILNEMTREELGWTKPTPGEAAALEIMTTGLLFRDPPDHTRLRSLVHRAFTPHFIENLRGRMQAVLDELLDKSQDKGKLELIGDVAIPLPLIVIAEMLGVRLEDMARFRSWSKDLVGMVELVDTPEMRERSTEATHSLADYFRSLAEERRKHPKKDLISALVEAEQLNDRLSEPELISTCILLMVAGHETTANSIGNAVLTILQHPDQLAKLKADFSLLKSTTEELLRYDCPVQMSHRTALQDIELKGNLIRKGTMVSILMGAANRDPEKFHDPGVLDITRDPNPHLSFSQGIHYCIGAQMARMEIQILLKTLLTRMPKLEIVDEQPIFKQSYVLRGLQELTLRF